MKDVLSITIFCHFPIVLITFLIYKLFLLLRSNYMLYTSTHNKALTCILLRKSILKKNGNEEERIMKKKNGGERCIQMWNATRNQRAGGGIVVVSGRQGRIQQPSLKTIPPQSTFLLQKWPQHVLIILYVSNRQPPLG